MTTNTGPLVSVVIPSYNHGRYLGRALQSVLDQTYNHWEAFVIDNHSTDDTDEILNRFVDPRITVLKIFNNGVIAASRNMGIRAAKGDWVAFLDSDDWWTSDKLQACLIYLNDKVDFLYHDLVVATEHPSIFKRKKVQSRQVKCPVLMDLLLRGNAISNSSVVVRKSRIMKIGGINECVEMIASEDYNTWLRIAQQTDQFVYVASILGYCFKHSQNISRQDMSIPNSLAVAEFVYLLSERQKHRIEANLRYIKGRFNEIAGDYAESINDLLFVLIYGNFTLRIRAFVLIFKVMFKKFVV